VLLALVASGLGYLFAFLLSLSPSSLEVAGLVLVVLLPGEFVIMTLRTREPRRERHAVEEALLLERFRWQGPKPDEWETACSGLVVQDPSSLA